MPLPKGFKHSEETKRKISKNCKGFKGHKHTKKSKLKMSLSQKKVSTFDRFISKITIDKKSNCWLFHSSSVGIGYKQFWVNGKCYRAHRYSYQLFKHKITPKSLFVLHSCDRPNCVNPEHLFLGTQQDNIKDRDYKNRQNKGENRPQSKLTKEQVKSIKKEYIPRKITTRFLAKKYNVSQSTVFYIINGKNWKHI